ncbi:MAG: hypothetical protein O2968_18535 [Acidobacteria bacterium]|nr:hypothetical protein [Acidobacteriota bacterium]
MNRRDFLLTAAAGVLIPTTLKASATPLTDEEKEQFLLQANVVRKKGTKVGTTGTSRLTLRSESLTHDASLQSIDVFKDRFQTANGMEFNFRDSYKFNIAAYRLDRLVNLNMVPVSVERRVDRKSASVTWWVDDVQMLELDRYKKKISAPNRAEWNDQMQNVRVFNELVFNTDPNLGNLLITNDWKLRMIDFSRAFRTHDELRNPKNLTRIDQRVYDGLRSLSPEKVERELGSLLGKAEVHGLLARKDRIVQFFEAAIAEKGEAMVVCKLQGH